MRDHLPECPVPAMEARHGPLHPEDAEVNCICIELRACEERVADEIWGAIQEGSQYKSGFEGGLDAARKAVACGLEVEWFGTPAFINWQRQIVAAAVAAIDALHTGQEARHLVDGTPHITNMVKP